MNDDTVVPFVSLVRTKAPPPEVDLPGLTSPMLSRFEWTRLPRPVIPLDDNVEWRPPRV